MKKIHKQISVLILVVATSLAYWGQVQLTESLSQNLVTFFSVVFGFYMTCVAILFSAPSTKKLYHDIDPEDQSKRKIDTLKSYFIVSSYCSIVLIITYSLLATKNGVGVMNIGLRMVNQPYLSSVLDINMVVVSFIVGVAGVNIFFMVLFLNTILNLMIEESKM